MTGVLTALALLFACIPATTAAPAEVVSARVDANSQKTRFIADLKSAVGFNVYVLKSPYRVIIDLPDAIFDLSPATGTTGKGLISGIRFGQLDEKRSRIVIDVTGPVLIESSYAVRAKADRPARLIVDLIATSRQDFEKAYRADQVANLVARENAKTAKEKDDGIIPSELPPISNNTKAKKKNGSADQSEIAKLIANARKRRRGNFLVVIDPGHGGIDPGATSPKGLKEKNIVLAFAKKLRVQLARHKHIKVALTRESDKFIRLRNRAKLAHKLRADLFISIHADSFRSPRVRGTALYTLSEKASDEEAAELAERENRADIIGGVNLAGETKDVTNILIDLAQRETKNHSVYFGKKTIIEFARVTRMRKRPIRSAGFVVLKAPDVPSVLIELGYLSNKHDAAQLNSTKWQNKMAKALAASVAKYFQARIAFK